MLIGSCRDEPVVVMTALHGAGGYGKTTIAIALCHDLRLIARSVAVSADSVANARSPV
jgi:cellulose biosynthesis protein BcsQ